MIDSVWMLADSSYKQILISFYIVVFLFFCYIRKMQLSFVHDRVFGLHSILDDYCSYNYVLNSTR